MKKLVLAIILLFSLSTIFTGCREEKKAEDHIEEAAEEVGDAVEDAADEIEDEI
ncbi:hypothetical protein KFZ70_13380 [Tamlana fucoidanivorans]|uniref:hypothetical protein n=1 Tax=Allotamlana fucoidanivorans TaxID=2583814 RepID=UPI0018EEBA6D|nr:hypothetical protein [Tamlana fucoidanivorans]